MHGQTLPGPGRGSARAGFVADLMIVSASMALLEAARNSATKPALAISRWCPGSAGASLTTNPQAPASWLRPNRVAWLGGSWLGPRYARIRRPGVLRRSLRPRVRPDRRP